MRRDTFPDEAHPEWWWQACIRKAEEKAEETKK
jgi:hypothetical protein